MPKKNFLKIIKKITKQFVFGPNRITILNNVPKNKYYNEVITFYFDRTKFLQVMCS